jgi:hypothetical protein
VADRARLEWRRLHAQLTIRLADATPYLEGASAAWFDASLDLSRAYVEQVEAQGVLPDTDTDLAFMSPGTVYARIHVVPPPGSGQDDIAEQFLPAGLDRIRSAVATRATSVWLMIDVITDYSLGLIGPPSIKVIYDRNEGDHTWLVLDFESSDPELGVAHEGQERLIAMLRAAAELTNPSHGEISYQKSSLMQTALEFGLSTYPFQTLARSAELLRGYGWVTIASDALVERVGGIEALRRSGAFVEVSGLRNGGVWLQATQWWEQYGAVEAERVFAALAPVLPAGRPDVGDYVYPNFLAEADASDYR